MSVWTKWHALDNAYKNSSLHTNGLYEIRMIERNGQPARISRLRGADEHGILYIGHSRYLGTRLLAFKSGNHTAGDLYWRVYRQLMHSSEHGNHKLQFRVRMFGSEVKLKSRERTTLRSYLIKFCELPPLNSTMPGGVWD